MANSEEDRQYREMIEKRDAMSPVEKGEQAEEDMHPDRWDDYHRFRNRRNDGQDSN